jgi:hypothetical protein
MGKEKIMKIEVTAKHIRQGQRAHACKCPVALAVTEAFGRQAYVNCDTILIPDMDSLEFIAGEKIRKFTQNYDLGEPVVPFSFDVVMDPDGFVCR